MIFYVCCNRVPSSKDLPPLSLEIISSQARHASHERDGRYEGDGVETDSSLPVIVGPCVLFQFRYSSEQQQQQHYTLTHILDIENVFILI